MANDKPLSRTVNRVLLIVWLLYLACALGYSLYTTINSTGLGGRMVAWQLALLGWGSSRIAVLLTMGICCVPLVLASVLFRKLNAEAAKSFQTYQVAVIFDGFPKPMTWVFVFRIAGGMLLVGALICAYLFLMDKQEETMPVYQVSLTGTPTGVNHRTGFVELTGIAASKYTLVFHNGGRMPSTDAYVPVVEPGWTPAIPIRYIAHYPSEGYSSGPPNLPYEFVSTTSSVFPGKLSGNMVEGFKQRYRKRGLQIAPDALFVDWVDLPNHHTVASYLDFQMAGIITIAVVGMTFLMLSLAKLQNGRLAARR